MKVNLSKAVNLTQDPHQWRKILHSAAGRIVGRTGDYLDTGDAREKEAIFTSKLKRGAMENVGCL